MSSVYMLEVDEDSRLGSELIAGGTRYHAHFVPDEDAVADFYIVACEALEAAGIAQYEISNFARAGFESRHNLKYWTRQPYLGFGVDAHSMLPSARPKRRRCDFRPAESWKNMLAGAPLQKTVISAGDAMEEAFFLGLRLNRGVDLREVADKFGSRLWRCSRVKRLEAGRAMDLMRGTNVVRLTARGRLLSNEVFQAFLMAPGQG